MEKMLSSSSDTGSYCHGDTPTMADVCLVPQLYTARRFGCDLSVYPAIERIEAHCLEHPAFQAAAPDNQPDMPIKNIES